MKYFTIEELCKSNTAKKYKINNKPQQLQEQNLKTLIEEVLDQIREKFGKPINVSSGYRCEKLNKLVGGSKNSFHLKGCAADLYGKTNEQTKQIFKIAKELNKYSELFYENNGSSIWVHIAYDKLSQKHLCIDNYKV